ncbi:MAG: response regulator, partial [Deltaproteobacteria bacterium]
MRILICEDDPSRSEALGASVAIACPGAEVQRAVPGTSVARAVAEAPPALTVVGPGLADADGGGELVRALCSDHPELAVLVVSTRDLAAPAVAALRAGAADYVVLGQGDDLAALGRAAARLVRRDGHRPPRPAGRAAPDALAGLVGRSPA